MPALETNAKGPPITQGHAAIQLFSHKPPKAFMLMVGAALIYLAFLPAGIYSIDGNSMLAVAESVVSHGTITVPANIGVPGRGGAIYSALYPLQSILAIPFVAVGTAFAPQGARHYVAALFASVLPILMYGGDCCLDIYARAYPGKQ